MTTLARCVLAFVATALLAGCGAAHSPTGVPAALPAIPAVGTSADDRGSWMLPEAKSQDLIYVTTGDIKIFTFPSGKYVGLISDTESPLGLCSDKSGDVFVANRSYEQVAEYRHASSKPVAVLKVKGEPLSCAIDPSTGDLAVTLEPGPHPGVAIFAQAKGKPRYYFYNGLTWMWYCTYDNHKNLFADGANGTTFGFVELASGDHSFKSVELSGSYDGTDVGAVQWDGKYVTLSKQVRSTLVINRLVIRGGSGKVVGSTILRDFDAMAEIGFKNGVVLGASAQNTSLWNYPTGGRRTMTLRKTVGSFGVTVSVAPHS